jgi:hypothetical protein
MRKEPSSEAPNFTRLTVIAAALFLVSLAIYVLIFVTHPVPDNLVPLPSATPTHSAVVSHLS